MTITRDIVLDLLPLYAAGEASRDTQSAVESFVASDVTVAALLRALQEDRSNPPLAVELPTRLELTAVHRTRTTIRRRGWLFGLALLATLLPLSFAFGNERVTFFMLRDQPASAVMWVAAGILWWRYARLTRELKTAGL